MDQILKGIINSDHPKAFKQQLIDRCLITLPIQSVSSSDYLCVLNLSWEYAVNGDSEFVRDIGIKVYSTWITYNKTLLIEFFNISSLNHFLSEESIRNKDVLVKLMGSTLKQLQDTTIFATLCQIIQCRSISYLNNNRTLPVLKELITLLQAFPQCIPCGESAGSLAVVIIQTIADIEIPTSISILTHYMADIKATCAFIPILWSANKGVIEKAFNAIFLRLSSEEPACSPAISCAIDILPLTLINNVNSNIGKTTQRRLAITVIRMLNCLSWPGTVNLDKWIVAVFRGLAGAAMYTFLAKMFEATIEQVYNNLYVVVTRKSALNVLSYMLLSYQHSPVLFHKIAGDIPKLLESIKAERTEQSKLSFETMASLFHKVMHLHAGFPDLYDPILQMLKVCIPPPVGKIQEELLSYVWGKNMSKYISGTDSSNKKSLRISRCEAGLIGLENIGNTCYMNSVLQALYMTGSIRNEVLGAIPNQQEIFLSKLQEVFAYLALSQRPAYSPKKFLESTRPSWFEPGEQQDCAEFLRYTLDALKEESKTFKEESLVESTFGGIIEISTKCLTCNNVSTCKEKFTDLNIAFPESCITYSDKQTGCSTQPLSEKTSNNSLSLEDLIEKSFEPERLEGDNKYHCEKCNVHCIAERSVKIACLPSYLILILLRFRYNPKLDERTKILTEVNYPLQLKIPCGDEVSDYFLYAVIVHSGTSTERGHYYTFARHAQVPYNISSETNGNITTNEEPKHWYLINDSKVSDSSFDSFRTLTQRFPTDTAYVLFYQKLPFNKALQHTSNQTAGISKRLKRVIIDDNLSYLQEKENETQEREEKANLLDVKGNFYKDFDDTFPPSGGCGSSSGGSDASFPRFIY